MKKLLCIVACMLGAPVHADPQPWTVHTVSQHYRQNNEEINNLNPGIAYDPIRYTRIGAVVNSYKHLSAYAAVIIPLSDNLRLGVGGVTGYGHKTRPLVAIEYDIKPGLSILWFGTAINVELKF